MKIFACRTEKFASAVAALAVVFLSGLALTGPALPNAKAQEKAAEPKASATPAGNAARGKAFFTNYGCYHCHGTAAQGEGATGPRLAPRPIPFTEFLHQLRQPSAEMPPYTAKVTPDSQVADIYAFLQTLPAPPKLADVPLLK